MTLKLPSSSKEMQNWEWSDYVPYFENLLNQDSSEDEDFEIPAFLRRQKF